MDTDIDFTIITIYLSCMLMIFYLILPVWDFDRFEIDFVRFRRIFMDLGMI